MWITDIKWFIIKMLQMKILTKQRSINYNRLGHGCDSVYQMKALGMTFSSLWESEKMVHLCPTLCDPMDCSLPGFSVHGILQARILEWVAIPFSRRSSQRRDWTRIFCTAGRFFTVWDTKGRRNSPQPSVLQCLFRVHTLSANRGADFSIQSVRNEIDKDLVSSKRSRLFPLHMFVFQ